MKNENVSELQKRKIEDVDDSFEFFLPNKLREKPKPIKLGHSCRNTETLKKGKNFSFASSSSSQESCDSDIERIVGMCLSKDSNITSDTGIRRTDSVRDWNKFRRKMKRQPILMTRSKEERETILSQKLGLILVTNEIEDGRYSKIEFSRLVNSEHLLEKWCQPCRLWSAAREPFLKINEFYLSALSKYIEISDSNIETLMTEKLDQCVNSTISDEIIAKSLSPPPHHELMNNNSDIDIFECDHKTTDDKFEAEEKSPSSNVSSPDNKYINMDCQLIGQQPFAGFSAEPCTSYSSNLMNNSETSCVAEDIINISSSSSSSSLPASYKCIAESSGNYNISEDSQKTFIFSNNSLSPRKEQIGMLDRIGVTVLAEQWENLFNTDSGDVTVLLALGEVVNVHKIVLTVRCQPLVSEINEDSKLDWSAYNVQAARAFFRYVYTGKCDHLWNLDPPDKVTVKSLSYLYKLTHLEQVLIKFHSFRCFSQLEADKGISHLNVNDKHLEDSMQFYSPLVLESDNVSEPEREEDIIKIKKSPDYNKNLSKSFLFRPLSSPHFSSPEVNVSEPEREEDIIKIKKSPEYNRNLSKSSRFGPLSPPNFSSPEVSPPNYEPAAKKRSLEKYFKDSFLDLPSAYGDLKSPSLDFSSSPPCTLEGGSSICMVQNKKFEQPTTPCIENLSISNSPVNMLYEKNEYSIPSKEETLSNKSSTSSKESLTSHINRALLSPNNLTIPTVELETPSTSTRIVLSKIATPFPDYDSMKTPQVKKELNKIGVRSDLRANKAKLLLKYIYEQTHPPIVESTMGIEDTCSSQVKISSNIENAESLKEIISRLIKRNTTLYTHALLFRPIWFQDLYELLKDNGIICSKNELKDTLNDLCLTYRTEGTENTNLNKKSRKRKKNMILSKSDN